jgi:acyl-coenzyme A synthetase/AMP-(fatty) acid ligase/acyl carrier protein
VDDEIAVSRRQKSANVADTTGRDTAYIIHTSGTSGRPKGVEIGHRSLESLVDSHQTEIYRPEGVGSGDVAMVASFVFDSSLERMALVSLGYTVHILSDTVRKTPDQLISYLVDRAIRNIDLVPSHLRVLVDAGLLTRATELRLLIVGGEAISIDLWETLAQADASVFNVYGPTENTINTTICKILPGSTPHIGKPLPGVECRVVDADDQPTPIGQVGELIVGGRHLAHGYVNDTSATTRSFRLIDAQRFYWTGDLVEYNTAGELVFQGRADDQVKVNGHRIEIPEIVNRLIGMPDVRHAAVTTIDIGGATKLLASVVWADDTTSDLGQLKENLSEALPIHMVPAYWQTMAALPLTDSLKLDQPKIGETWRSTHQSASIPAPRPPTQKEVAHEDNSQLELLVHGIWQDVLKVPVPDRDSHFFAIGGDSLAAMNLIVALRTRTEVKVELADIIRNPTIRRLSAVIGTRSRARVDS